MGTSIGGVQAIFTADTKGFDTSVKMTGEQLKVVATAAEQAGTKIAQAGEKIDRTAALQEKAAERARRAWQREKLQQDLASDSQKEAGRAAELAALKADILARSIEGAGNAAGHSVPQFAAASGAIRVLEGGMNNNVRAAERFLSTTLGLGPVLTAAFPIVGAIALVGVLSEMVERIGKFAADATTLSNELGTNWLSGAIGQMDGLASATKQADEEVLKLHQDQDRNRDASRQIYLERVRLTAGSAASDRAEATMLRSDAAKAQGLLRNLLADQGRLQKQASETSIVIPVGQEGGVSGIPMGFQPTQAALKAQEQLKVTNAQIANFQGSSGEPGSIEQLHARAANLDIQAKLADQQDAAQKLRDSEIVARMRPPTAAEKRRQQGYAYLFGRRNQQFTLQGAGHQTERAAMLEAQRMAREPIPANVNRDVSAEMAEDIGHYGERWKGYNDAMLQGQEAQAKFRAEMMRTQTAISEATGAITKHQAAIRNLDTDQDEYKSQAAYLGIRMDEVRGDSTLTGAQSATELKQLQNRMDEVKNEAAARKIQDQALIDSTTALGQFRMSLIKTSAEWTNGGGVLGRFLTGGIEGFNSTLVNVLSTPRSMMRGKHPWDQLGASVARSAATASLQFGEGKGMQALGRIPGPIGKFFGGMHKPSGTAGDPLFVKFAGTLTGASNSPGTPAGNILTAATGAASGAQGVIGALGGFASTVAPGIGAAFGAASDISAARAATAFIPGFADGGPISSNMPSIVGENGPELFVPRASGHIVPNGKLGGGDQHFYIDARGSNDPAAIHAAVNRALVNAAPHMMRMAQAKSADDRRRSPASSRR